MRRLLAAVVSPVVLGTLVTLPIGCQSTPPAAGEPSRLAPVSAPAVDLPETEDDFLRTLMPLPGGDVRITYCVSGPAGMQGTLVATARAGGYRHESWSVEVPLPPIAEEPAGLRRVEGSRVGTPDLIWSDAVAGAPVVRRRSLGALAEAFVDLEPGLQSLVMFRVRGWRDDLAEARDRYPGVTDEVQGQTCLVTTVASHRVCVWEETGLPLSYEGDAFHVRATAIESGIRVDERLFEIPAGGQHAPEDRGATFFPWEAAARSQHALGAAKEAAAARAQAVEALEAVEADMREYCEGELGKLDGLLGG